MKAHSKQISSKAENKLYEKYLRARERCSRVIGQSSAPYNLAKSTLSDGCYMTYGGDGVSDVLVLVDGVPCSLYNLLHSPALPKMAK